MITIHYIYKRKTDGLWYEAEREFLDVRKALRFLYSIRNKSNYIIQGWDTDDQWDNEWLNRRFNY